MPCHDSLYDCSEAAVTLFQNGSSLPTTGVFDSATAAALLACCSADGYVDAGVPASAYGKLYKIVVPLASTNRSIEVR